MYVCYLLCVCQSVFTLLFLYLVFGLDSGGLLCCLNSICIEDDEATDRNPDKHLLHLQPEQCVKLCICICTRA